MRVTNTMMSNRMLLNIHRNMNNLSILEGQFSSQKKVIFPSDNPILAARALKFRTNITETEQYQRNVSQGLSWMSATDKAFMNMDNLMANIRTLCNSAASGEKEYKDKQAIIKEIEQYIKSMADEVNVTYAGRYVFSGYRTDNPPIFQKDDENLKYTKITQYYTVKDVEFATSFQKTSDTNPPDMYPIRLIKLPYTNIDANTLGIAGFTINETNLADPDAYKPDDDKINFIPETGELILGKDAYDDLVAAGNMKIEYDKTGFKEGDLNPKVYFTCKGADGLTYEMKPDEQRLELEFGTNTRIQINSLAKDSYTDKLYSDLRELLQFVKSVETSDPTLLKEKLKADANNQGKTDEELGQMVDEIISDETKNIQNALRERFNNMLGLVDRHFTTISNQQTDLGSRMKRLDLINDRLDDNLTNFEELRSLNEDAEMEDVIIKLSLAKAAYNASLQAGAGIIQMTLANYIR